MTVTPSAPSTLHDTASTTDELLVCGAGLAGMSVASQVLERHPGARVTLVDRRQGAAPEGAFKVGESFVELASWHLRHHLHLEEHLTRAQIPKLGLRFFMNRPSGAAFGDRLEYGVFPHRDRRPRPILLPTYNVDRGRLENHLRSRLEAHGARFIEGARITHVVLGTPHSIHWERAGRVEVRRARYVVDASGTRGLLKRAAGLEEPIAHASDAAWVRTRQRIDVDQLGAVPDRIEPDLRWRSTNHLVGDGYWMWLIPLASGGTSVGIVCDPRRHRAPGRLKQWLAFVAQHEPELATALDPEWILDHRVRRGGAYGSRQLVSADGWAVIGDAGYFLDPLYSPSADFIALQSALVTGLFEPSLSGGLGAVRQATFAERLLQGMFDQHLTLYRGVWDVMSDALVMATKVAWDTAAYFAFNLTLYQHGLLTDAAAMGELRGQTERLAALQRRMQGTFRREAKSDRRPRGLMDQFAPDVLYRLYTRSVPDGTNDGRRSLQANLDDLEQLGAAMEERLTESSAANCRKVATNPLALDAGRLWGEIG